MSNWLRLAIVAAVVCAFTAAVAQAATYDLKYSESFSATPKKVGSGDTAEVQTFKSGRFSLQASFKFPSTDEAPPFDVTSTFTVSLWSSDVTSTEPIYTFSCEMGEFSTAFGEESSATKSVDYTATNRTAKAVRVVKDAKDRDVVVESVTLQHSKDKKSLSFMVTGTLVNTGSNTAPCYSGTLAAVDPDDEAGGSVDPGTWFLMNCNITDASAVAKDGDSGFWGSLAVEGTRMAKIAKIKLGAETEATSYFAPSLNLKAAAKGVDD